MTEAQIAMLRETFIRNMLNSMLIAALVRELPEPDAFLERQRSIMEAKSVEGGFYDTPNFLEIFEDHLTRLQDEVFGRHRG